MRVGFGTEQILVEGWKLINEALRAGKRPVELWIVDEADATLDCQIFKVTPSLYQGISPTKNGKPPLAIFHTPELSDCNDAALNQPTLLLDQIQDPGNAGALVRAATAFGFRNMVWHKPSIFPFHHACIRSSAGTVFHTNHYFLDSEALEHLTGQFIGAELHGTSLKDFRWPKAPILVMGNEGHGLSKVLSDKLQQKVTIPISDRAESLNVAGAAHILMYDFASKKPETYS